MKLIDKSAVVAEIEARYNECLKRAKIIDAEYWNGKADAYRDMLVVLDTLEVKEVDLEKEYKDFVEEDPVYNKLVNGIVGKAIAKHFFELGMQVSNKAQKGE